MSRKPCCSGEGLKKGAWTTEEDKKLIAYIQEHGEGGWRDVPQKAGLKRCGKSCRLRWTNYLKPDIKRGEFSQEEEQIIIMLHASRGNKWSAIARHLPRRTDNEIKNYWNTHLKKRLIEQGIDPLTHKPLASNPRPLTPENLDSQNAPNPDEQSRSGPSPRRHPPQYSGFNAASEALDSSSNDESPRDGPLSCKKQCFSRSGSTSRLLNRMATKVSSIKSILSASMEGGSSTPTSLSSPSEINNAYDHQSQISMASEDLFSPSSWYHEQDTELQTVNSSSEIRIDHAMDDVGPNANIKDQEFDFSDFLDEFGHHDDNYNNNNNNKHGYNHNHLISEVSSTSIDEDMSMSRVDGSSDYLLGQPSYDSSYFPSAAAGAEDFYYGDYRNGAAYDWFRQDNDGFV